MSEKTVSREVMAHIHRVPKWGMTLIWTLALISLGIFAVNGIVQATPFFAAPSVTVTIPTITPMVVAPGQTVVYLVRVRNTVASPLASGVLTVTLPAQLDGATMAGTAGWSRTGNVVTRPLAGVGNVTLEYTVSMQLPMDRILHDPLEGEAECFLSNGDGADYDDAATSGNHYIVGPIIQKALTTSVNTAANDSLEAAAGEIVTTTSVFSVPAGTIAYNVHPYVVLEDGLMAGSSVPEWISVEVGLRAALDPAAFGNGTQVSFEPIDVITGPDSITYTVVATRTRDLFTPATPTVIPDNTPLSFQPLLRWCASAGCTEWETTTDYRAEDDSTAPHAAANRPNINSTITYEYQDAAGVGEGGGPVLFTITNDNSGRVSAYDNVLTATLSLSYVSATPAPFTTIVSGATTLVVWHLSALDPGDTSSVSVQAQLPATFEFGAPIPALSTQVYQESFAGDVPYEGGYVSGAASISVTPGIAHSKSASLTPTSIFRMGQEVTYTVVFTQGANTILTSPGYTDTLPLGLHLTGTLSIEGATLAYSNVVAGPGGQESIVWGMDTLPANATARVVRATYRAVNTGLDYTGQYVYTTVNDLRNANLAVNNSAVMFWQGTSPGMLPAAKTTLRIIQPFLGNSTNFVTDRMESGPKEIEQSVQLRLRFRNTTSAVEGDAYEVRVCDQLPTGFGLNLIIAPTYSAPPGCTGSAIVAAPSAGDNPVCWTINRVCRASTDYTIVYYATIGETVMPGVPLYNHVYIDDYTSMPGTVATERHYGDIPTALPTPASCGTPNCPIFVNGLAVSKQPWQTDVVAGGWLTYTIRYSDTSVTNYNNVVITDTYDASLLSFVSATPPPASSSAGVLVWNIGSLNNTNGQIVLTMKVAETIPDGVTSLMNTVLWDSDQTTQHQTSRIVPLQSANVNVAITGPANTHADDAVTYSVIYSNTGSSPATINLTMDYDPYMDYVAASTPPVSGDNVFAFADVPNDGENYTLTVQLHVQTPLPYTLAGPLETSVLAESSGAVAKSAQTSTILDRPVLALQKSGPLVAPGVGQLMQFEIYVTNLGTYTATNLVFTDTWDLANLTYRDANHQSHGWMQADGTYVTREHAQLGIGETVGPIYFDATVKTNVTYYTNTVALNTDQTTKQSVTEYVWQASIETTKAASATPAFPGRVLTYTVAYTNTGSAVLNARITDTLPAGFVYLNHSEAGGTGCAPSWSFVAPASSGGGSARWGCPAMAQNATGKLVIWGEIMTTTEGTDLINTTLTSGDGIPLRPIFTPLVTRSARPWLRVNKAVVPDHPAAPGDELTYVLTYQNYGTDPAYDVVIVDQLPAQLESAVCSGGDSCSIAGDVATWNLAEVGVGEIATVQVTARVRSNAAGQTAVNSAYSVRSSLLSTAETLSGPAVSTAIMNPHISLAKTVDPLLVTTVNGIITYTLTYTNDGGGDLPGVVITDNIDARMNALSVSPECVITGSAPNQVVTCDLGTVPQGESASLTIRAQIVSVADGDIASNVAGVRSDRTALLLSNDAVVAYAPGGCIPPVGLNFTTNPNPRVGRTVTFTASVLFGNTPLNYNWILEGETVPGAVITYTYAVSGTYQVTVMAGNECKSGVTKVKNVAVWDLPEVNITPASFSKESQLGATTTLTDMLVMANTGSSALSWSVAVDPASATWLNVGLGSGAPGMSLPGQTTPVGGSTPVSVYFNPAGLTAGSHTATLAFTTNDPDHPQFSVPVTFVIVDKFSLYLPLVLRNFPQQ